MRRATAQSVGNCVSCPPFPALGRWGFRFVVVEVDAQAAGAVRWSDFGDSRCAEIAGVQEKALVSSVDSRALVLMVVAIARGSYPSPVCRCKVTES